MVEMNSKINQSLLFWHWIIYLLTTVSPIADAQNLFNISPDIKGGFNDHCRFFTSACDSAGIFVLGEYPYYKVGDSSRYYLQFIMLRFDYDGNLIFRKNIPNIESSVFSFRNSPPIRKNDSIYYFNQLIYQPETEIYYRGIIFEINIRTGEIITSHQMPKLNEYDFYALGKGFYDQSINSLIFATYANLVNSFVDKLMLIQLNQNLNIEERIDYQYPGYDIFMTHGIDKINENLYTCLGEIHSRNSNNPDHYPIFIQFDSTLELKSVWPRFDLNGYGFFFSEQFSPTTDPYKNWVVMLSNTEYRNPDSTDWYLTPYIMKFNSKGDKLFWKSRFKHPLSASAGCSFFPMTIGRCNDGSGYIGFEDVDPNIPDSSAFVWMFKVSENGDSLWSRQLYILGPDEPSWFTYLYPIVHTPYNTFIAQGSAGIDRTGQWRPWLVHFDYHGCVVPGCHLTVNSEDPSSIDPEPITVFPNPVNGQHLYFTCRTGSGQHAQLEFLYLDGRSILRKNIVLENNAQYLLLLPQDLANGYYLLQIHDEINSWSKKVYVQR